MAHSSFSKSLVSRFQLVSLLKLYLLDYKISFIYSDFLVTGAAGASEIVNSAGFSNEG